MTLVRFLPGFLVVAGLSAQNLPLDGVWRFQLDRDNLGIAQRWHERVLAGSARLPGNL